MKRLSNRRVVRKKAVTRRVPKLRRYTREQWYNIMSAIRGPDNWPSGATLKRLITARIRSLVVNRSVRVPATVEYTPISIADIQELQEYVVRWVTEHSDNSLSSHYVNHLIDAVGTTSNEKVWGSREFANCVLKFLEVLCVSLSTKPHLYARLRYAVDAFVAIGGTAPTVSLEEMVDKPPPAPEEVAPGSPIA